MLDNNTSHSGTDGVSFEFFLYNTTIAHGKQNSQFSMRGLCVLYGFSIFSLWFLYVFSILPLWLGYGWARVGLGIVYVLSMGGMGIYYRGDLLFRSRLSLIQRFS